MKNIQVPEGPVAASGTSLAVNSTFYTVQGEGPFAGSPAVFIRLAGCNLQCPACDTEYSSRSMMEYTAIVKAVKDRWKNAAPAAPRPLVVITGGEPFRQPINKLVEALLSDGYTVQIETNGTLHRPLPFYSSRLFIVCSPKTGNVHKQLLPHIHAFKYVLGEDSMDSEDGLPLRVLGHPGERVFRKPKDHSAAVYIQPQDSRNTAANTRNLTLATASAMKHGYKLCIQIHKIVGVP